MQIGEYSFQEFKDRAAAFHSYPAPGVLIGGYMVEATKRHMPADVLYEAVVETGKCLPDAVQLLTPCSTGNGWMKVINLGRYALTLYDKHTGQGWRAGIDLEALQTWPEIRAWFLKLKSKQEQDEDRLLAEIEDAGDRFCTVHQATVHSSFLGKQSMGPVAVCTQCGESYPERDGEVCRGCQGQAPYADIQTG